MSQMEQRFNVLFTAPEYTLGESIAAFKAGAGRLSPRRTERSDNLVLYRPSHLFPRFYRTREGLNSVSTALRMWEIRRTLRARNWNGRRVAYVWQPDFVDVLGRLDEAVSVFHCHDYYPALQPEGPQGKVHPEVAERRIRQLESCLQKADLVVTASEAIADQMRAHHDRDYQVVENGVNFEVVNAGLQAPCPAELEQIPRPIVGCIGRINQKIDCRLLLDIALARPDWSVLLMGPVVSRLPLEQQSAFDAFLAAPNTFYIEGRPWNELPPYFAQLDVGLMPYRMDGIWTRFGFPLKFYEYLAVGKPTVSSKLLPLEKYQSVVHLAEGVEQWVEMIERSLEDPGPAVKAQRIELAEQNSWKNRSEQIINMICDRIGDRSV